MLYFWKALGTRTPSRGRCRIFLSKFFPDTYISLYFLILRGVSFVEFFDLVPPSFAKMHIYVYIADLHGEVGQNILNGQKNMLKR